MPWHLCIDQANDTCKNVVALGFEHPPSSIALYAWIETFVSYLKALAEVCNIFDKC